MKTRMRTSDVVTDGMLEYLDDLRESGRVNMFGAGEYVEAAFGLEKAEARKALVYWMQTFGERHND